MSNFFESQGVSRESLAESKKAIEELVEAPVIEDNNDKVVEQVAETPIVEDKNVQGVELSDDTVLGYLNKKLGKEVKSFDELMQVKEIEKIVEKNIPTELPEDLAVIKKFKDETNRPIEDFFKANKDWTKEAEDLRIKEFLKAKNPSLDDDLLNYKLNKMKKGLTLSEDDMDDPDARDAQMDAKLEWRMTLADADSYLNGVKEKYKIPISKGDDQFEMAKEEFSKGASETLQALNAFDYGVMPRTLDDKKKQALSDKGSTMSGLLSIFKTDEGMFNHSLAYEVIDFVQNKAQIISDIEEHVKTNYKSELLKEQNNYQENPITNPPKDKQGDNGYRSMMDKLY